MRLDEVDPWMAHRIRLADRRGLLTGTLSRVQARALEYLLWREDLAAFRQERMLLPNPDADTNSTNTMTEDDLDDESAATYIMPPTDIESVIATLGQGAMTMRDMED